MAILIQADGDCFRKLHWFLRTRLSPPALRNDFALTEPQTVSCADRIVRRANSSCV